MGSPFTHLTGTLETIEDSRSIANKLAAEEQVRPLCLDHLVAGTYLVIANPATVSSASRSARQRGGARIKAGSHASCMYIVPPSLFCGPSIPSTRQRYEVEPFRREFDIDPTHRLECTGTSREKGLPLTRRSRQRRRPSWRRRGRMGAWTVKRTRRATGMLIGTRIIIRKNGVRYRDYV